MKVRRELRLKMIVMLTSHSLGIHVMSSQVRIRVQCVTKSLHRKCIWHVTVRDTLETTCIRVLSVRNFFHLRVALSTIWIFIAASTSAQNVADVVTVFITWQDTEKVIQERNRLNVLFVANDLHCFNTSLYTAELTLERNHSSVTCVTRRLHRLDS